MDAMARMNPFKWFFPRPRLVRVCLFGSDNSGKTTILYKLKLGEIVTTIPTIGFNVETIDYRPPDAGRKWEFVFWDVGGCDRMIALMHHYIHPDSIVLFVHDCHDVEREDFSLELLHEHIRQMLDKGARYLWVLLNKQDMLPEEKRASLVAGLQKRFEDELRDNYSEQPISWRVLGLPGLSGKFGDGLYEVLEDVTGTLSGDDDARKKTPEVEAVISEESGELSSEQLRLRAQDELSHVLLSETFWASFLDGTLPAWNHASHLQAGYLVLLETLAQGGGIFATADVFLQHLARLRDAQSDRFRNTAHVTMTVFWLLQLIYAAAKYQTDKRQSNFPTKDQFKDVAMHTPNLMDRGLWKKYYTKNLMFSPAAKEKWHLPDLTPLPSISTTEKGRSNLATSNPQALLPHAHENPDRLLEYAFEVVKKSISGNIRRGALVKQALESLQKTTMQQRAHKPNTIPPYSETQACFWIQIAHVSLQAFQENHADQNGMIGGTIMLDSLNFSALKSLYNLNGDTTWREYYSPKLWLEDLTSRMQFVSPDLKPLPNVIQPLRESVIKAQSMILQSAALQAVNVAQLPSKEVLAFFADCLVSEAAGLTAEQQPGASSTQEVIQVSSHTHLIWHLYSRSLNLSTDKKSSSQATALVDKLIIDKRNSYTERCFWIRQVMLAATTIAATSDKNSSNNNRKPPMSFRQLLQTQPHLAYEKLPFVYYSAELWNSAEAVKGFMPPDR